ncbi:MAG: GNAT family N-acetyltransferase, partial [Nocardioidaceae bacterium]|nr:GNAT family N-acetyltransferase [Nocardioidaceae bacterium]
AEGGLGRHRVQLGASWNNAASRGVAERAGFRQVGHFRLDGVVGADPDERVLEDGAWYDLIAADRDAAGTS